MTPRKPARDAEPDIAPPHSLEIEQTILGALLLADSKAVERGLPLLHPRLFYRRFHADICHAARRVMQRTRNCAEVDFITVYEELRAMGRTDSETFAYMRACVDICPGSANIEAYIRVLLDKSRLRYYLKLSQRTQQAIAEPDADSVFIHAATQNALNAINTHGWCDIDAIFTKGK